MRTCIASLLLALLGAPARAAPWIHPAGAGQAKLAASRFSSDARDPRLPGRDGFEAVSWTLSGELGLSRGFELGFELPYTVATNRLGQRRFSNHSLGDAKLSLHYALLPALPLAAGLELKVPLYSPVSSPDRPPFVTVKEQSYPTANFPEVGDGTVDLSGKLSAGRSLGPAWLVGEVGYRLRLGPAPDALGFSGNLGGWVVRERLGAGLYSSAAVNLQPSPAGDEGRLREWLYVSTYLFVRAAPWLPRLQLGLSAGSVVASNSVTGTDLSAWLAWSN